MDKINIPILQPSLFSTTKPNMRVIISKINMTNHILFYLNLFQIIYPVTRESLDNYLSIAEP